MRDYAQVKAEGAINRQIADQALNLLSVDQEGFDGMDRRVLLTILDKFAGGPVGLDSLAAAISEERDTIEDVIEPFLIQQGFLMRTPRGRVATAKAYTHFGMKPPEALDVKPPQALDVKAPQASALGLDAAADIETG